MGLPLASQFNHTVAMDLKSHANGVWILHLIDTFTKYSADCVVKSKDKDVIVEAIFKIRISYFGRPKRFYADNCGEFNSDVYRDTCENQNAVIGSTAAESPWLNGLCERHNTFLGESIDKIIEDTNCSLSTVVSLAVSVKNALQNNYGYSPNQLVFGQYPNFPNVLTDSLPASEGVTCSQTIASNLNAMHKAREAFILAESSEKIWRALRHNVRSSNDAKFEMGDIVYFKRNDNNRWGVLGL